MSLTAPFGHHGLHVPQSNDPSVYPITYSVVTSEQTVGVWNVPQRGAAPQYVSTFDVPPHISGAFWLRDPAAQAQMTYVSMRKALQDAEAQVVAAHDAAKASADAAAASEAKAQERRKWVLDAERVTHAAQAEMRRAQACIVELEARLREGEAHEQEVAERERIVAVREEQLLSREVAVVTRGKEQAQRGSALDAREAALAAREGTPCSVHQARKSATARP